MSTTEKPELTKRSRGDRVLAGRIGVRLPAKELAWLDAWAQANGYSRSAAIRRIIALTARKPKGNA